MSATGAGPGLRVSPRPFPPLPATRALAWARAVPAAGEGPWQEAEGSRWRRPQAYPGSPCGGPQRGGRVSKTTAPVGGFPHPAC